MIGLVDGNNFFVSCERVFNRRLAGRPVAVLPNNDGCCVSRSTEFKALGIPCGVGFAPTKTLAKIANHIGKKRPDGVFMLPDDPTDILASLPADEVWGVGRRQRRSSESTVCLRQAATSTLRYSVPAEAGTAS